MSTILIIDDSIMMRKLIGTILNLDGHTILEAEDGVEGVAVARTEQPDLILLDMMMPIMSGDKVAKYMHDDTELCSIPIILLTALKRSNLVFDSLALENVRGYFCKPFDAKVLRRHVRNLFGEANKAVALDLATL